jgi:dethiobiotin synthetase
MRFFVTGTDTGIGKTEVSCALLSLLRECGVQKPFAFKPCESGDSGDSTRLQKAAGNWQSIESVCPMRFSKPLAPFHAAQMDNRKVNIHKLLKAYAAFAPKSSGIVEGAGGLFVPLTEKCDVIDLIEELKAPVILVARAGLGTINHTSLSVMALRNRKIKIAAVVLSQSQPTNDLAVQLNRNEIERRFPTLKVFGPVPYLKSEATRQLHFMNELRSLIVESQNSKAR